MAQNNQREDMFSLNGQWEYLLENGDKEVWKVGVANSLEGWQAVDIPGEFPAIGRDKMGKTKTVWAKKEFPIGPQDAKKDAVLRWNGIRFGAVVWINGREVSRHPVVGPCTTLLPKGCLKAGENILIMKISGYAGVPRGKSGTPLIPVGNALFGWGMKAPMIFDDIWLEFYEGVYIKWAQALPNVVSSKIKIRVWLAGLSPLREKIKLTATIAPWRGQRITGRAEAKIELPPAVSSAPTAMEIPIEDVTTWAPEKPFLYIADLTIKAGEKVCDRIKVRFGMREFKVVDGHYQLNGRPFWLRGSNLVCEWLWKKHRGTGPFVTDIKGYVVDEARLMSLNSFRTHTLPPPKSWADVCDENGMMILAELPVTYNWQDFEFTSEEYETFHRNVLRDATGWVTTLWNHPSIVTWVLTNESPRDNLWEAGEYRDHVVSLDPSRPCMRSGTMVEGVGTKETMDMHLCSNLVEPEGQLIQTVARHAREKDPRRTLSNSEYMNLLQNDITTRSVGFSSDYLRGGNNWSDANFVRAALNYAEFAAEHTEAMRRVGFDGILPYMYSRWGRMRNDWRVDYPSPMAAALHSAMAPVLASIDLFDRNYLVNQEMNTTLCLINEKTEEAKVKVDWYVTPIDPLFVPDTKALEAAVSKESFDFTLKPSSREKTQVRWKLPDKEGNYFLAAVLTGGNDRPVVSQRVVRALKENRIPTRLQGHKVIVLGAESAVEDWLKAKGLSYGNSLQDIEQDSVVLIWDVAKVANTHREAAPLLLDFARSGGKIVILQQNEWRWKELVDFELRRLFNRQDPKKRPKSNSRAFIYEGAVHPMFEDIDPEYLKRWNGLPGVIARTRITGPALDQGKRLLWAEDPKQTVGVTLPLGKGEIIICQLDIKTRLQRRGKTYDPVAERILINLLK